MKVRFAAVLTNVSEDEAQAVYKALAQWADNTRNAVEETDAEDLTASEIKTLELVESVVERFELVYAHLADADPDAR